jgi:hypothetical protein
MTTPPKIDHVSCEYAAVRVVERRDGRWSVTINGENAAMRPTCTDARMAALDLARGIDDCEVEYKRFPGPRTT